MVDMAAGCQQFGDMPDLQTMTPEEMRALRDELRLTQRLAAEKFNVTLRTYKYWEDPKSKPISGPAVILARHFLMQHRKLRSNT